MQKLRLMELINYELNGNKKNWLKIKIARNKYNKVNEELTSVIQKNW
jgi:hypothetical protein